MDGYHILFPAGGQGDEPFLLRRQLADRFDGVVQDISEQAV